MELTRTYTQNVSVWEYNLSYLGVYLLVFYSVIGFLWSSVITKHRAFLWSIAGLLSLFVTFMTTVFGIYLFPDRWWYYSQHFLPLVATLGVVVIVRCLSSSRKAPAIALIVVLLSPMIIMNVTDSVANIDSPIYTDELTVRRALTSPEAESILFLQETYSGVILTDLQASAPFSSLFSAAPGSEIIILNESLMADNAFLSFSGLIVLREHILEGHPFDAYGIYRIVSNPRDDFDSSKELDLMYDSGVVYGFIGAEHYQGCRVVQVN